MDRVKEFIKDKTEVSVPMLQRGLSLSYKQAKAAVDKLLKEGVLAFERGVAYRICRVERKAEPNSEPPSGAGVDSLAERFRRLTEMRKQMEKDGTDKTLSEREKTALWYIISEPRVTVGMLAQKLDSSTAEVYEITKRLHVLGYIIDGFFKLPKMTREEYIEKFGDPDKKEKNSQFSLKSYFESAKLRTAVTESLGAKIGRKGGDDSPIELKIGDERFILSEKDNRYRIEYDGKILDKNTEKAKAIAESYKNVTLSDGTVLAEVGEKSELAEALFGIYAAIERIKLL